MSAAAVALDKIDRVEVLAVRSKEVFLLHAVPDSAKERERERVFLSSCSFPNYEGTVDCKGLQLGELHDLNSFTPMCPSFWGISHCFRDSQDL